jgi:acyl-CoA thioesterase YciA
MDLTTGSDTAKRAHRHCATVAVDGTIFHTPVHVGDDVSVYADLISTGHTSMRFQVKAWRHSHGGDEKIKVTEAIFTSVAIGSGSCPRPLPSG